MTGAARIGIVGLVGLVVAAGLAAAPARYSFSHAAHLARDPALTCTGCHDAKKTANGRPTRNEAACKQCHDDVPLVLARNPVRTLKFTFEHRPHADVACATCHGEAKLAPGDVVDPEHTMTATSATCFGCHANQTGKQAGAPREQACTQCHGRDERAFPPPTHAPTWRHDHGKTAGLVAFAPMPHGQSCTLCHKESACTSCHRVEKPEDHSAVWGERLHGVVASFDRARCKTCHETGQCISCHKTTEPANHRGAWKSTHGLVARSQSDSGCATCHRPSFCLDCHRGGAR